MFRSNVQLCDQDDDHLVSLAPPRHLDSHNDDDDDDEENNIGYQRHQRDPHYCPHQQVTHIASSSASVARRTTGVQHQHEQEDEKKEMMEMQFHAAALVLNTTTPNKPSGIHASDGAPSREGRYQAKLKPADKPVMGTGVHHEDAPGAVRERGIRYQGADSTSMSSASSDISDHGNGIRRGNVISEPFNAFGSPNIKDGDIPILTAEVVVVSSTPVLANNNSDNNNNVQSMIGGQFRDRADEIAQQVVQQLRGEVKRANREIDNEIDDSGFQKCPANNNIENNGDSDAISKRKWLYLLIGFGCIAVAIIVVVLVVVMVVVTQNKVDTIKTPPPTPITKAPRPLSSPPPSAQTSTIPPTLPSPSCGDLPCKSTSTVMELVSHASNHTLLAQYLNREFNSDLKDYLSSEFEKLTLFAPTDESFLALPPPFSLYISDNNNWILHLYIVLATHIIVYAEDSTEIFQSPNLQTKRKTNRLSVDMENRTIENGASIIIPDIHAGNGYIQVPDRVINILESFNRMIDYVVETYSPIFTITTKFRSLLNASGWEGTLLENWENGMTLYVPEDSAFAFLDESVTSKLFGTPDLEYIKDLVAYHILNFNFDELQPQHENAFWMFGNVSAWSTNYNANNDTFLNFASNVDDYIASNGFLHLIDRVLLPPQNVGQLLQLTANVTMGFNATTFMKLVRDYAQLGNLFNGTFEGRQILGNYFSSNDNLLVFAPVELAFTTMDIRELLTRLLHPSWLLHLQSFCLNHFAIGRIPNVVGEYQLHMMSGFELTLEVLAAVTTSTVGVERIDGAAVKRIRGSGNSFVGAPEGVIRFLDDVLLPPWFSQSVYDKLLDITQDVSTFVNLVQSVNFSAQLLSDRTANHSVTVFAPNNAAIANDAGSRTTNITSLQEFVLRHFVFGNMYTAVLINGSSIVSMANVTLQVSKVENNNTFVGGALILDSNMLASNGVVHVIDHVL